MGGPSRKFKAWAGYEFGTAVGNLPGRCEKCRAAHRLLPIKKPPCERLAADHPKQCPKYKLYPERYGLHPKNSLVVQLYSLATRDQRAGMDAVLIGTLTASDARSVIELYSEHLPTPLARQRIFELMMTLDHVATTKRSEQESRTREMAYEAAKNGGGSPMRRR